MVRTGKCGITRKIEGIKSIVLVGLRVSAAQGPRAITFLPSRVHRISEFLQHCCKVKGFKKSSETVCSHCCHQYCFWKCAHTQALLLHGGLEISSVWLLLFTSRWLSKHSGILGGHLWKAVLPALLCQTRQHSLVWGSLGCCCLTPASNSCTLLAVPAGL